MMLCRHCGKPASRLYRSYCNDCIDWAYQQVVNDQEDADAS